MARVMRATPEWELEIGHRIRLVRRRRALTQAELARDANVSLTAVQHLESGRGSTLRTFISVVRALDIDDDLDRALSAEPTVSPMAVLRARERATRIRG
jgi:transcriptional regulator with XRE-family HTH domain